MNVVIAGGGEIGALIAEELHRHHSVSVVDLDESREVAFEHLDVQFVRGNAADPNDLLSAGVDRAGAFVACTTNDDVNVLACLAAKGLGAKLTMAFVTRQRYIDAFKRKGAYEKMGLMIDRVVWPQRLLALQIADIVRVPRAIDSATFKNGRITLLEYRLYPEDRYVGHSLESVSLPDGVLVVGLVRDETFSIPTGATLLAAGDRIVFLGLSESMRELQRQFAPRRRNTRVAVVGGGNVGFMVAEALINERTTVTIIEEDAERCQKLAQWLPNALVLNGDGTDIELLQQERLMDVDVMVAVTDDDGKNLLVSLISQQLKIPKVITRVGRARNRQLFTRVGIDSPLTPRRAAVKEVLNWLKVDQVDHLATIEDRAEVMDVEYPKDAQGGRVVDLDTPAEVLIGAIERDTNVIVPRGDTLVRPGDHLLIVTTPDRVDDVERWLDGQRSSGRA